MQSESESESHEALEVDDVLRQIMVRLPMKPFVRSRLVNRQWDYLFSDPDFSNLHTRIHAPTAQPWFIMDNGWFYRFNHLTGFLSLYDFNFNYTPRILFSSHGLLLITCKYPLITDTILSPFCRVKPKDPLRYMVCNPTTRQLRPLHIDIYSTELRALCLVFDPSKSPFYKVVFLQRCYSEFDYILHVYDSQSHTFKKIRFTSPIDLSTWKGVYWNDRIYLKRGFKVCDYYVDLVRGNVGVKRGPALVLPKRRYAEGIVNYLMGSNGHFYCVSLYMSEHRGSSMIVFELVDDNSGWIEKHRADLMPISDSFSYLDKCAGVMGIFTGDGEGDCSVLLHAQHKAILYRFSNRRFEVVFEGEDFHFRRNLIHQYTESLAPV